jgi:hypothetical protein
MKKVDFEESAGYQCEVEMFERNADYKYVIRNGLSFFLYKAQPTDWGTYEFTAKKGIKGQYHLSKIKSSGGEFNGLEFIASKICN